MTLLFDIETTGHDTFIHQVTAVGVRPLGGRSTLWVRRAEGSADGPLAVEREDAFLRRTLPLLADAFDAHRSEAVVTWNGSFDFNFVSAKALRLGLPLGDRFAEARKRHVDLKRFFQEGLVNAGQEATDSNVLEHLLVGRSQLGRENLLCVLWFAEGKTAEVERHLEEDLAGLEALVLRLGEAFPATFSPLVKGARPAEPPHAARCEPIKS